MSTAWETEDDVIPTAGDEVLASPSKLSLFKQRHPGAYTNDDLNALNLPPEKQKSHHRVWLVLVDSEFANDWGIVEDTQGDLLWTPGKGEIVGTWTHSKLDNRIHISLLSSINALEDKSIAIWTKYAEERKLQKAVRKTTRTRKTKEPEAEHEPVPVISIETKVAFNSLRAKLKRGHTD